ncbi:SAM-dependent methyltransferase [Streptomyces litchfieldiae]|uniref:SAM-dependent methyltransferase n=1 Tax=Streptomyces litchfieldiae TaxID=3075543 RepID=A0ABU2MPI2_9ACTN|nr:SAM-dependent methyltransferase [Streptomyces sp. DSM 44938]MDT0343520.1 SAM-dependent methyltransferase [Streptomyces sp. DSM 44938]
MADEGVVIPGVDASKPSIARVYDYLLGGKDNFAVDRELGDVFRTQLPGASVIAHDNRRAMVRAVAEIAAAGVRQFIDIGSGLPTADNVHQVAQRHAPEARVVYVDNDPVVLAHGRALLEENDRTTVIRGDLRDPATIRDHEATRRLIDFDQPVAVILSAILHHLNDDEDPAAVMRFWREAVPSGSHVFVSHFRRAGGPEADRLEDILQRSLGRGRWRTDEEIGALMTGLTLLPPGITPAALWRPGPGHDPEAELTVWQQLIAAALAVKP